MRPGTPGFVGTRLREAREARGLTATLLADLLGVSRQAMSQYENGSVTPHPDMMDRLCEKLNLPPKFFWRPAGPKEGGAVIYRSMSAATKGSRVRAERRLGWLQEIVGYLRQFLEFPRVNFPTFALPEDPTRISTEQIEESASQCRRFWGLADGPIPNVVRLLENNGAIVSRDALEAETLDAFSVWSSVDGLPYVVLNSEKESAVRSRYDVAHELGHLVLHPEIDRARLNRAAEHRLVEQQAHLFAGAFLLPAPTFAEDFYVPTLDSIRRLKSRWKVSIGAMIKRARQLELMTDEQERRLWINYSRRGWRTGEPLDDVLSPKEPQLLRRAIEVLVDEGIASPEAVVEGAPPYQPSDIEHLACLPDGYFSEGSAPGVRLLKFRNRTAD
jgi:Zn-dependent peptidase ImmA (M78 family)/DNA-binding XRE family transcriptional regulator